MSKPKLKSNDHLVGKGCVVEVLGLGYFRVVCENGRGELIYGQPQQQVCAGDIGWVISYSGQFYGGLRFIQDNTLLYDFERAKMSYPYVWKNTWPWPVSVNTSSSLEQDEVSK